MMITRRNRLTRYGFVVVILAATASLAVLLLGQRGDSATVVTPSAKQGSRQPAATVPPKGGLGFAGAPFAGALDNESYASIPLSEALQQAAPGIVLPAPELVGKPVRVVLLEGPPETRTRANTGLAIRYDSGIDFFFGPNIPPIDMKKKREAEKDTENTYPRGTKISEAVKFKDGREYSFDIVEVNGRETMFSREGVQLLGRGGEYGEYRKPALVTWWVGENKYQLGSRTVPGDRLLEIARAIP